MTGPSGNELADVMSGYAQRGSNPPPKVVPPKTMAEVEKVVTKWLGDEYVLPLRVALATYIANEVLDGDPVWVLFVGGSGFGKTETIMSASVLPFIHVTGSITGEAALLSLSPKRDENENSTGGILRQIGPHGVLIVKDFTSILDMRSESRQQLMAAFREIGDGSWTREAGTDGGTSVKWEGKLGMIGGVTTAIDTHWSVTSTMGARWMFLRVGEDVDADEIAERALMNTGQEKFMRDEMSDAVLGLIVYGQHHPVHDVSQVVIEGLKAHANLTTLARSPVTRTFRRDIELVGDREAPTRAIKMLAQIWRACGVLGIDPADSWEVVRRLADDSVPKMRRLALSTLVDARFTVEPVSDTAGALNFIELLDTAKAGKRPDVETWTWRSTAQVADACKHSRSAAKEALEELYVHGLADKWQEADTQEHSRHTYWWRLSDQGKTWAESSRRVCQAFQIRG